MSRLWFISVPTRAPTRTKIHSYTFSPANTLYLRYNEGWTEHVTLLFLHYWCMSFLFQSPFSSSIITARSSGLVFQIITVPLTPCSKEVSNPRQLRFNNMSIGADSGTRGTYWQRDMRHLLIIKQTLHTCPVAQSHTAHLHFAFFIYFISLILSLVCWRALLMCLSFGTSSGGVTIATTLSSCHQSRVFLQRLSAPPHWPTHIVWLYRNTLLCYISGAVNQRWGENSVMCLWEL